MSILKTDGIASEIRNLRAGSARKVRACCLCLTSTRPVATVRKLTHSEVDVIVFVL